MIVRPMHVHEFDLTMLCVDYYKDEAMLAVPSIAEEYDENSVIKTVRSYASRADSCWYNAYDGQRVVGFVAGYLSDQPWNKEILTANIVFLFLLESHRNMENFKKLMAQFEEWAKINRAKYITGGDIGINVERSQTLYQRFGFTPILLMNKEIDNG